MPTMTAGMLSSLHRLEIGQSSKHTQFDPYQIIRSAAGFSVVADHSNFVCSDVDDPAVALAVALSAAHLTRVLAARDRTPPPKPDAQEPWLRLSVNIGPK